MQNFKLSSQPSFLHYIPFAFCSFLSLMAMFGPGAGGSGAWTPAFLSFLPMCFFWVATVTIGMQREIKDLRERLQAALPAEAGVSSR